MMMTLVMGPVSHISLPHFAAVYTHTMLTDEARSDSECTLTLQGLGVHSSPVRLYHVKLGAAPDNTARLQRRLLHDIGIASLQMDGDVTVEQRQAFACFIEDLFLRCCNPTGQLRDVVQKVLRKQLNCTLATWVKLSTQESDAVYERAVCILREITAFREGNIHDLQSQLIDSAVGPEQSECRAILDSILDPKWTTDEESLVEVFMIDQEDPEQRL